jgi:hypothetical protein
MGPNGPDGTQMAENGGGGKMAPHTLRHPGGPSGWDGLEWAKMGPKLLLDRYHSRLLLMRLIGLRNFYH